MKKENIWVHLFFCTILLLAPAFVLADEISNIDSAEESELIIESSVPAVAKPSDIVTTEIVSSNAQGIKKNAKKSSKLKATTITDNTKASDDAIGGVLLQAMSLMGISYKWGGNTPETGMDCSGFIRYVFKKSMGIDLPRTAAGMSQVGIKVNASDIQPGDLILFNTIGGRRNTHIGMYIGNNQFIQSPRTGEKIQISDYNAYWKSHTNGIKRIVQENVDEEGNSTVQNFEDVKDEGLPSGYIKGGKRSHGRRGVHGRHHRHQARSVTRQKSHTKIKAKSSKKKRR